MSEKLSPLDGADQIEHLLSERPELASKVRNFEFKGEDSLSKLAAEIMQEAEVDEATAQAFIRKCLEDASLDLARKSDQKGPSFTDLK